MGDKRRTGPHRSRAPLCYALNSKSRASKPPAPITPTKPADAFHPRSILPVQIVRALRASRGGIAAAPRALQCTRKTMMRHLDVYTELAETAWYEVELALDLVEHSLFVDAASPRRDSSSCSRAGRCFAKSSAHRSVLQRT